MAEDKQEEISFLPEVIKKPKLPSKWDIDESIERIKKLTSIAKREVEDIVIEFWIAHEWIVNKKPKGWTWGRFCKETGYSHMTPYRWFEKCSLPITKLTGRPSLTNVKVDKPLKKLTKPETKIQLDNVKEEMKTGNVSNDDAKELCDTVADLIEEEVFAPRVGSSVGPAVKKKLTEKKEKKPVDHYYKLMKDAESVLTRFQLVTDGHEDWKIITKGDRNAYGAIKHMQPGFVCRAHYFGVDVIKVYNTLINPKKKIKEGEEAMPESIDVEFREV